MCGESLLLQICSPRCGLKLVSLAGGLENVYASPSRKAIVARATGFIESWLNPPGKEAAASRPVLTTKCSKGR